MSNEEVQRKMDFIVEQQAQFASDMQVLRESQAQTDQVVARLAYVTLEGFKDVNAKIDVLVDSQIRNEEKLALADERLNAKMAALTDSQIRNEEKLALSDEKQRLADERFNAKMDALADSQARVEQNLDRTEESLRNLITVVDRHISEGRNGN